MRTLPAGLHPAAAPAGAGSIRNRSGIRAWRSPALTQALLIAGLFAVLEALIQAGGVVARVGFMGGAASLAFYYWRRSPWLYLTAVFWFWTITPLARRLINLHSGFAPTDLVLATPNVMSVFVVVDLLRSRNLLKRPEAFGPLAVVICLLYGFAVNLVDGEIYVGAIGAMDWLLPVLYFLFILEHLDRIDEAERHLRDFLMVNGAFIVAYGALQAVQPPAWDVAWALATGDTNTRDLDAAGTWRVFGSLNDRGAFAFWLAALIVLSMHFRTILTLAILPVAGMLLLMTNSRSVLGTLVLSLCFAAVIGGPRISRGLLALGGAIIVLGLVFGSLNPAVVDHLVARYSSLTELQYDDSALTRAEIWRHTPQLIDRYPVGLGLGAIGRGAAVSNNVDLVSVDFGVLGIYLSLGWVAGSFYIISLLTSVATAVWSAWRSRDAAATAFAAVAIGMTAILPSMNVVGFGGAILWLSAGLATALGLRSGRGRPNVAISRGIIPGASRRLARGMEPSQ